MINRIRTIRKRWLFVAATVALLTVGLVSGAAFAASSNGSYSGYALAHVSGHTWDKGGRGHGDSTALMSRVAEILGIEQSTLQSAFATAADEQAEVKFDARIAELVADETLTQEQGDAATAWFDDRPEQSGPIAYRVSFTADSDRVSDLLTRMVDAEKITQEEADAISAWHGERPESLPESAGSHRGRHGKRHGR